MFYYPVEQNFTHNNSDQFIATKTEYHPNLRLKGNSKGETNARNGFFRPSYNIYVLSSLPDPHL